MKRPQNVLILIVLINEHGGKKNVKNKRNGVTNIFVIMFNKVICKSFKLICKQMDNYSGM